MGDLKSCPFCGSKEIKIQGNNLPWVQCVKCLASSASYETKEEAMEAWNTRCEKE